MQESEKLYVDLVNGYQDGIRAKLYPAGLKDRKVIDATYDKLTVTGKLSLF